MLWVDRLWRFQSSLLVVLIALGLPVLLGWAYFTVTQHVTSYSLLGGAGAALATVLLLGFFSLPGGILLALTVLWQNRSRRKDILREALGYLGRLPVFLLAWLLFRAELNPWLVLSVAFSLPLGAQIAEQLQEYPPWYKELSYAYGGRRRHLIVLIFEQQRLHLIQIFLRHLVRIAGEFLIIIFFLRNLQGIGNVPGVLFSVPETIPPMFFAYLQAALVFLVLQVLIKFFVRSKQVKTANG